MAPRFIIAAASSGCGKTTFTMGLLRAWQRRGWNVQPFKCGPDYIDTQFHAAASGKPSVNLDIWLSSEDHIRQLYSEYGAKADACVVEGVMGLFDGFDRMKGSAAHIAQCLGIPVVLLVNAKSAAYSVAPLIYGFKHFNPSVQLAGVVFNQVASKNHFSYLQDACADAGVPCFGYIPKCPDLEVPSRHLGLSLENREIMNAWIDKAADLVEQYVDMEQLAHCCMGSIPSCAPSDAVGISDKVIAVARDEAFSFTYLANLRALKGKLVYFSPLHDDKLPDEASFVYLPGGYPEFYLPQLSANTTMLQSIRDYAAKGGHLLAECGGMIYLSESMTLQDGSVYPLSGVLPIRTTMQGAKLHLGYRRMLLDGKEWLGHEFHYSTIINPEVLPSIATQYAAKGNAVDTSLYRVKNVLAGYTHWYWADKDLLD